MLVFHKMQLYHGARVIFFHRVFSSHGYIYQLGCIVWTFHWYVSVYTRSTGCWWYILKTESCMVCGQFTLNMEVLPLKPPHFIILLWKNSFEITPCIDICCGGASTHTAKFTHSCVTYDLFLDNGGKWLAYQSQYCFI